MVWPINCVSQEKSRLRCWSRRLRHRHRKRIASKWKKFSINVEYNSRLGHDQIGDFPFSPFYYNVQSVHAFLTVNKIQIGLRRTERRSALRNYYKINIQLIAVCLIAHQAILGWYKKYWFNIIYIQITNIQYTYMHLYYIHTFRVRFKWNWFTEVPMVKKYADRRRLKFILLNEMM